MITKSEPIEIKPAPLKFKLNTNSLDNYIKTLERPKRWVIINDVHCPYHDSVLFYKLLAAIKIMQPYGFIINGDFGDFASISRHTQNSSYYAKKNLTLSEEYNECNKLLDLIDSVLPTHCQKVFLMGNHSIRVAKFLQTGDNANLGTALKGVTESLLLKERGYEVIEEWPNGYYELVPGHLIVEHGFYLGMNAAKQHIDKNNISVIHGHNHKMTLWTTEKHIGLSNGGLFDKNSEGMAYAYRGSRSQWQNGFCVVDIAEDGRYGITPIVMAKGGFFLDGVHYA